MNWPRSELDTSRIHVRSITDWVSVLCNFVFASLEVITPLITFHKLCWPRWYVRQWLNAYVLPVRLDLEHRKQRSHYPDTGRCLRRVNTLSLCLIRRLCSGSFECSEKYLYSKHSPVINGLLRPNIRVISTALWNVTPCGLIEAHRRFGGTYYHHLHCRKIALLAAYFLLETCLACSYYFPLKRQRASTELPDYLKSKINVTYHTRRNCMMSRSVVYFHRRFGGTCCHRIQECRM